MICKLDKTQNITPDTWHEFSLQLDSGLTSIMLMYSQGNYHAFKNLCPHQGRRMDYSLGKFLLTPEGNLVCPAHGAEFKMDSGLCIDGPCLGESLQEVHLEINEGFIFAIIE